MKKTLHIDEVTLRDAKKACGAATDTETVRLGLEALIRHAAYERATFVRSRKLHGRGIGWIDAHLLASALVADTSLWTADEPLARLAGELGIAHRPHRP